MIAFLTICYAAFYWVFFVKLKLFAKSARNISIFVGIGVVLIGAIVFMWLTFAPTTPDGRMFQFVIQIVPNVKGTVIEVPVEPLVQVNKGEVLYRIDPTPYQANVDHIEASIKQVEAEKRRAEIEVERETELVGKAAAAQRELDRWTAQLDEAIAKIESLNAQLDTARWQLDETEVRAPHDGYVVNLQVRPGTYVANIALAAAMTFISDEIRLVVASFSQNAIRNIQAGDLAEVVFSHRPGRVYTGVVTNVVEATGTAQLEPSGNLPTFRGVPSTGRYAVRINLDDPDTSIPQGAGGTVAVYTQYGKAFHIITKVVMRMQAWLAYLTSP
ncbi:MAG: efflux RND transporter periplasmic adaptor subunit [Arenicellales bacterium]|nr:efflux RND transporter periplasmic adaptor subunit [Arenicellales bacterium]